MTDRLVFPSSFDSTRYTAVHARDDHPNLAQAQAEAITSLLLGRPLGLTNTYAFDSRSVLNLVNATLQTRDSAKEKANPIGKQRIYDADPFKLRWYAQGNEDFLGCCAEQLRRLAPPGRFILSAWKKIDRDDQAREDLAQALTSQDPRFPDSIREIDDPYADGTGELEQNFETLIALNKYCQGHDDRGGPSGKSHISLLGYVEAFESLDVNELQQVMDGKIDVDTIMHLRESISGQPGHVKGVRSWAHQQVVDTGGEDECGEFLLQQRQLIDTLYNEVLADSVGSNHDLLSSVPRTVGNKGLEEVNAFALNLIRFTRNRQPSGRAATDGSEIPDSFDSQTNMSELFVAASAEPDLPASPLRSLLMAYWRLIAEDDTWLAWQESCDYLEKSLNRALRLRARGRADSQLTQAWYAHLDLLQDQLPHVTEYEGKLATAIELNGKDYFTLTGFSEQSPMTGPQAESLAAGEYIDRFLRVAIR